MYRNDIKNMYRKDIKQEKENLSQGIIAEKLIYACLMTCEDQIIKNAYLQKKWHHCDEGEFYESVKLDWMEYREKLRSLLLEKYSMKEIIQNTKSKKVYTDRVPMTLVKKVIGLVDKKEYTLCPRQVDSE